MSAVFCRSLLATACEFRPPRSASGLRLMNRLPRLTEAFPPEAPMEEPTSPTAGPARTTASALLCRPYIARTDTSVPPPLPPPHPPPSSPCNHHSPRPPHTP